MGLNDLLLAFLATYSFEQGTFFRLPHLSYVLIMTEKKTSRLLSKAPRVLTFSKQTRYPLHYYGDNMKIMEMSFRRSSRLTQVACHGRDSVGQPKDSNSYCHSIQYHKLHALRFAVILFFLLYRNSSKRLYVWVVNKYMPTNKNSPLSLHLTP